MQFNSSIVMSIAGLNPCAGLLADIKAFEQMLAHYAVKVFTENFLTSNPFLLGYYVS